MIGMTVKEWAREYPEVATALFNCSVDDLDNILEEKSVNESGCSYLTKADVDKLIEIMNEERHAEAEWIESVCGFNIHCSDNYHCSNCGNREKICTRFCSNCGKEMKDNEKFYWRFWN